MRNSIFILTVVGVLICSCATPPAEPTNRSTPVPSHTPSPTHTSTPTPTFTPTATITQTPNPSPTPSILDPTNVSYLRQIEVIQFETRPLLQTAFWTSDSKSIVVWTDEGWQLLDPQDLHVIEAKAGESPLWYGGDDQLLVLDHEWDVRFSGSNQTLAGIEPPEWYGYFNANTIAVSQDGNWLAQVLGMDEINIVSLSTGETKSLVLKRNYHLEGIDKVVFNHDGSVIAIHGYAYDRPVIVVDVASGDTIYEIANASMPSFSPAGSKLIVSGPQSLEIRNAFTGVFFQKLSSGFLVERGGPYGTYYNAREFSFTTDNLTAAVLYTTDEDSQLIIWDLATGNPKQTLHGMPIDVRLFSISPDGSQLLTLTPDARLRIWSLSTGEILAESEPYQVEDSYPSLNADGTMLAIPGIPQVKVIHLETGETTEIGDYADASRIRVAMVGNTHLAVEVSTATWEAFVDIWDIEENKLVKTFKNYWGCSFNAMGSHMVCNSNLQLFEVESGRLLGSYGPNRNLRYEWALSSDGKQFAVCSLAVGEGWITTTRSDNISIFDTGKNELRRLLTADERGICSRMAFSPDGQFLVASRGYVWSTRTASVVSKFETPSEYVSVSIDPSSQMILAGNELFYLQDGNRIGQMETGYGRNPPTFIKDGQFIAVVSENHVEFWGSNLQHEPRATASTYTQQEVRTPEPTWTPQPAHCIDSFEPELSEFEGEEFVSGRLTSTLDTWQEIEQVFTDEEILKRALKYRRCGASLNPFLSSAYIPRSLATIIGWTGYINGVGKIKQKMGNTESEILIAIIAYPDQSSTSVVHLPVTICVGRDGDSLCNNGWIRENPTDASPGNSIAATTLDEVAQFLEGHLGKTLRGFIIFPSLTGKDIVDFVDGLIGEVSIHSMGAFVIQACEGECYLNSMDGVSGMIDPGDVENVLNQTGEPWGFFLEGIYVYSE